MSRWSRSTWVSSSSSHVTRRRGASIPSPRSHHTLPPAPPRPPPPTTAPDAAPDPVPGTRESLVATTSPASAIHSRMQGSAARLVRHCARGCRLLRAPRTRPRGAARRRRRRRDGDGGGGGGRCCCCGGGGAGGGAVVVVVRRRRAARVCRGRGGRRGRRSHHPLPSRRALLQGGGSHGRVQDAPPLVAPLVHDSRRGRRHRPFELGGLDEGVAEAAALGLARRNAEINGVSTASPLLKLQRAEDGSIIQLHRPPQRARAR